MYLVWEFWVTCCHLFRHISTHVENGLDIQTTWFGLLLLLRVRQLDMLDQAVRFEWHFTYKTLYCYTIVFQLWLVREEKEKLFLHKLQTNLSCIYGCRTGIGRKTSDCSRNAPAQLLAIVLGAWKQTKVNIFKHLYVSFRGVQRIIGAIAPQKTTPMQYK